MKLKPSYVGVDPGKNGGIAVICFGRVIGVTTMILSEKKTLDLTSIAEWIISVTSGTIPVACIEKVGAMPGQGVTSMFSFGFSTGAIHGIFAALGIPRHVVSPQTWKKIVLANTPKDKEAAIDFCRRVYPYISLLPTKNCKKSHSGMADAICIARYALEHIV